jgi:hypothetical protein
MRHGTVDAHIHYSICKALGIETTDPEIQQMWNMIIPVVTGATGIVTEGLKQY